ncbi:MAG: ornithine carbamoyltransferase [archaeon]|nr:ornithine carbamoyltransferase [archaeon]
MEKPRHFLSLLDVSQKELSELLAMSARVKKNPKKFSRSLEGKTLAMLFQKTSTRTRVSFEAGMTQLGGHAIFLDWRATNFTRGAIKDEILSISRYVDAIMFRAYKNSDMVEAANVSTVPLINGLDNLWHPCQALADLLTIKEKTKKPLSKTTVAFVGDGNNVCNSLIVGCAMLGIHMRVGTPEGYEPYGKAVEFGKKKNCLKLFRSAEDAVEGADFAYTDTWISMGEENERKERLHAFQDYRVTPHLLGNRFFMHCLPAHIGEEVTREVLDSKNSIIYGQAENRLHAQKALLVWLLK